ncbi:hypothetical protein [Massilia sp. TN1-12]|uniref:hypothetical protein n=1 Tax=Massilia paldalensis TaxID=3377675 RepID=UPI00384EA97E
MIDYRNCVKVKDGVVTREPVPEFLTNSQIPIDQIADLTWLNIPEFAGYGWWPVVNQWPELGKYQSYDGEEVLTIDAANTVVISTIAVRDWTAAEIKSYKMAQNRRITPTALRYRFTDDEKVGFELAMLDDPTSPAGRQAAATMRALQKDLFVGGQADLNSPALQARVQQLETLGAIAAGRAEEIIWGEIEPREVP